MWLKLLSAAFLILQLHASLYIPGHTCDCPQYACQSVTARTCPMILCPSPHGCMGGYEMSKAVNPYPNYSSYQYQLNQQQQQYTSPQQQRFHQPIDELEMRAFASGLRLGQPTQAIENSQQLKVFEHLGDDVEIEKMVEEDLDLTHGLRKADIRRAPQITVREVPEEEDPQVTKRQTEASKQSQSGAELPKCNSQVLKKLMEENISDNSSDSKRKINTAAEEKFGGNVDVVCSRGHFSYVFSSNLYCETTKGLVTCIAFRQAV